MQDIKGTERCDCIGMSGAVKTMKIGGGFIPFGRNRSEWEMVRSTGGAL